MLSCQILPNGDLLVAANADLKQELNEEFDRGRDYWSILCEAFEDYSRNGSYTIFDAGDGNPNVGLTSAPCVAESMTVDDEGNNIIQGRLWWFPDYMVRDPLHELKNKGETIFTFAGDTKG